MPERTFRRGLMLAAILLALFGVCGISWLVATRPLTGRVEKSWICARCAEQRAEEVTLFLDLGGSPRTNVYLSEIAGILAKGRKASCAHEWLFLHDVVEGIHLRPLPIGRSAFHVSLDMSGITDQADFTRALGGMAEASPDSARAAWRRIVSDLTKGGSPEVQKLREMLGAKRATAEIAEHLRSLGAPPG